MAVEIHLLVKEINMSRTQRELYSIYELFARDVVTALRDNKHDDAICLDEVKKCADKLADDIHKVIQRATSKL